MGNTLKWNTEFFKENVKEKQWGTLYGAKGCFFLRPSHGNFQSRATSNSKGLFWKWTWYVGGQRKSDTAAVRRRHEMEGREDLVLRKGRGRILFWAHWEREREAQAGPIHIPKGPVVAPQKTRGAGKEEQGKECREDLTLSRNIWGSFGWWWWQ